MKQRSHLCGDGLRLRVRARAWATAGLVFLGSLCAGHGTAAEAAAAAQAPAAAIERSTEDAISAAKRDFETLKATRDPSRPTKTGLPGIALPELPNSAADLRVDGIGKQRKPDASAKRQSNWLVEAMDKSPRKNESPADLERRTGASERRDGRPGEGTGEAELASAERGDAENVDATRSSAARKVSAGERERERQEDREKRAATNPLTKYLGEWMTPGDFAVLRPGIENPLSARGASDALSSNPGTAILSDGGIGGLDLSGLSGSMESRSGAGIITPASRENPYLQAMQPALAPASERVVLPVTPPPAASALVNGGTTRTPPVAPIEPQKPRIPDFAKPAQDEKYFKQLKRF